MTVSRTALSPAMPRARLRWQEVFEWFAWPAKLFPLRRKQTELLKSFGQQRKVSPAERDVRQNVTVLVLDKSWQKFRVFRADAERIPVVVVVLVNCLFRRCPAGCLESLHGCFRQILSNQFFCTIKRKPVSTVVKNMPDMNRNAPKFLPFLQWLPIFLFDDDVRQNRALPQTRLPTEPLLWAQRGQEVRHLRSAPKAVFTLHGDNGIG